MADQPALYSMGTGDSLPRGKTGTGQANHSSPNGSKLKNACSRNSTAPFASTMLTGTSTQLPCPFFPVHFSLMTLSFNIRYSGMWHHLTCQIGSLFHRKYLPPSVGYKLHSYRRTPLFQYSQLWNSCISHCTVQKLHKQNRLQCEISDIHCSVAEALTLLRRCAW